MSFFKKRRSADQKMMDRIREPRMDRIRVEGRDPRGSHLSSEATQETDSGGKEMIKVTRLSGEVLYLNILQIESMESCQRKFEQMAKDANAIYKLDKLVLVNCDIFEEYLETFRVRG